ncbi:MAG: winged helix-turn-helix domain-containing protein [Rhodocyclaceae bacterium]|nr:winged helix-turn-helix domain-containing protein [Rhodocyclaceae bacterium]
MSNAEPAITYCFDGFELQPEERRLLVDGIPTVLGARAFDLLLTLIEQPGQLVTKDTLLERVWPAVVVEENNLQVQISTLRKLLGADAIATVVGRGYRFTRELHRKKNERHKTTPSRLTAHTNIPHNLGVLIGREQELVQLMSLIDAGRLVTVTGPGGVGKTRLMNQCALDLAERFNDGVWLVELATLIEPEMVAVSVAATLRIDVNDIASASRALINHVRDKQMLLVLDNCEHLVDAVAALADALLSVAPQLKIVASSQDILGVNGEQVFRVPSLTLPTDKSPSAADAASFGAIALFIERAKLGDIRFCCDDQNAPVITAICRRLDGIPLAIEMAAARVATLGLADVARMLDERFLALTAGRRGAVPRQRTLQATLDWSYSLLAERERIVFRRLASFVGGFTLPAAIAVAEDSTLSHNEVIDAISVLVSKSLLTFDHAARNSRYRLLEIARAYAQERLAESGETDAITQRTSTYFQFAFQACFDDWTQLSDADFEARYAPDLENLQTIVEWSFAPNSDARGGMTLVGLSGALWIGRLVVAEAERWLASAFAAIDETTPLVAKAQCQLTAGAFYYWRLNQQSIAVLRPAATTFQTLREPIRAGYASLLLSHTLAAIGDHEAEAHMKNAQSLLANCDRPRLQTLLPKTMAMIYYMRGMPAETVRENGKALLLAKAGGYEILALLLEENLADSLWLAGDLPQALAAARSVVEQCKQVSVAHKIPWAWIYGNLFGILTESGELVEAREIGRRTMHFLREADIPWLVMDHYALRSAKTGDAATSARIHGWINEYFLRKQITRQPNELRAMTSTAALLRELLPPKVLAPLLLEGAQLSEDAICQLAVLS